MTRGVCAPGMRQSFDFDTGHEECTRLRSYPNALSLEIGDPHATTPHERYCGSWINAQTVTVGDEKWAFFDELRVAADVETVILATGSAHLAIGDVGKFRTACKRMANSNAAGAAGIAAFLYLDALVSEMVVDIASADDVLRGLGVVASHYCDGPVTSGLTFAASAFAINVSQGSSLKGEPIREALYAVGASRRDSEDAEAYVNTMAGLLESEIPITTRASALRIVEGGYKNTWVESLISSTNTANDPVSWIFHSTTIDTLNRFLGAFASKGGGPRRARAYIRGLAAYCSFTVRSAVTGEFGGMGTVQAQASAVRAENRPSAALGRLDGTHHDRFSHEDATSMLQASIGTWSALHASPTVLDRASVQSKCLRAARVAFPDEFDGIDFRLLVTDRLANRLQTMVERVRTSVVETLESPLFAPIWASGLRGAVQRLQSTRVRIAGAPRLSWAGVSHEFVRPELKSGDGALLIMLKQAKAVYLDRLARAARADDVCDHPPLYPSSTRNAYLLFSSGVSCTMLLPGILVPPFADERYDEKSLYSRIGYVIAHEFMHVTADRRLWDDTYAVSLLADYDPNVWTEAIADVGGVAAIMHTGLVDNQTLCAHVTQLWCGRVGILASIATNSHHPKTNQRGDSMCNFLRTHFSN
jgi:hypothetical protein